MAHSGRGGPRQWQQLGGRPLNQGEGRKAGSKVPPAKRKAKNRKKGK